MNIPAVGQVIQLRDGRACQVRKLLAHRKTGEVAVECSDGGIHLLEDCHLEEDASSPTRSLEKPGIAPYLWHGIPPYEWDC